MPDLSVIIPARNELYLSRTIEDVLANIEADTEVIAVCDGNWPTPQVKDHHRVHMIHHSHSIWQRAAMNEGARLSIAKYIMKLDAHCAMGKGFDRILIENYQKGQTVVPRQYNLHVFDLVCRSCGLRTYMGPTPKICGQQNNDGKPIKGCGQPGPFEREMVWRRRESRRTDAWRFDHGLHFQYWSEFGSREEAKTEIAPTMSFIGACWFMSRERWNEIDGLDEEHGTWGQVGTEIACKSWLSGGELVTNKKTWYAHMFRTQGGDFSFPYPAPPAHKARERSRDLWINNAWPKQVHPLSWLLERFWPIPGWSDPIGADMLSIVRVKGNIFIPGQLTVKKSKVSVREPAHAEPPSTTGRLAPPPRGPQVIHEVKRHPVKGIIYYTENRCPEPIFSAVQAQLRRAVNGFPITSVSLKKIDFGKNIVLPLERGVLTMFKEILHGLEHLDADVAFLCEHDVLYHPTHFHFTPPKADVFYYNEHTYKVDSASGQAVFYYTKQTSGLCAYRNLLVEHYTKRIAKCEQNERDLKAQGLPVKNNGFSRHMGFEPGCHRPPRGVDEYKAERWMSEFPNVDIRHTSNLTRWSEDQFRDLNACQGWKVTGQIPGWGVTLGRFDQFLRDLSR